MLGWTVSQSQANTSLSQEGLCQYSKGKFTVSFKYRTKILIAFSPLSESPSVSSVWIPVKRPSLERASLSTLRVGSSFCSCNSGRWCWPCLSTWWPCLPRDIQSSALLSSLEGWHEFKPSWQPPISILLHKPLCNQKAYSWGASYSQAASWWFFSKAGHDVWETPQLAKHFGSESSEELQPCSPTVPNAKSFLWGKASPGSPRNHPAASRGVTGAQILVLGLQPSKSCQHVILQLHSSLGLSSLLFSGLERGKEQADEFCEASISFLWEFVVSNMWREITLDNKGYDIFSLLFRTERCAWVCGCKRESKRVSACVGLYAIAILSCFS